MKPEENEDTERARLAEALGVENDELLATNLETDHITDDNMKNSLEDIFGKVQEDTLRNLDYALSYSKSNRQGAADAGEVRVRKKRQSEDASEDSASEEDTEEYAESPQPAPGLLPNLLNDPVGSVIRLIEDFFVKAIGRFISTFLT